jgi:plasmid stabilization system protein ParE
MSGYALHPDAYQDLDEIRGYLSAGNSDSADRILNEIFETIRRVTRLRTQGQRRPDLTNRELRFAHVGDYLIAYAPDEKPLWIVAILHGHRSPHRMAGILRTRE